MYDFLDRAEELLQTGKVPDAKENFELVFRGLANLQRVAAKAHLDQYKPTTLAPETISSRMVNGSGTMHYYRTYCERSCFPRAKPRSCVDCSGLSDFHAPQRP
jgi:hypothetical protein